MGSRHAEQDCPHCSTAANLVSALVVSALVSAAQLGRVQSTLEVHLSPLQLAISGLSHTAPQRPGRSCRFRSVSKQSHMTGHSAPLLTWVSARLDETPSSSIILAQHVPTFAGYASPTPAMKQPLHIWFPFPQSPYCPGHLPMAPNAGQMRLASGWSLVCNSHCTSGVLCQNPFLPIALGTCRNASQMRLASG